MSKKQPKDRPTTALDQCIRDVLDAVPKMQTVRKLVSQGLTMEEALRVYSDALGYWGGDARDPVGNMREVVTDQLYAMLREALMDRDHSSVTRYMDMISRSRGTYAPERTETTVHGGDVGPESLDRLDELLRKHGIDPAEVEED